MRLVHGLLTALAGLLLAAPAWAGRGAEVAIVGMHVGGQSDEAALDNATRLADAIDKAGGVVAVPPGEVRARLSGRESLVVEDAFLGPGRDKLEEGRVLYERADLSGAIPPLRDAVEALTGGLAGTPDTRDLIDALLMLGLAHLFTGDADGATAAFRQVVILDPTRELDPVNYPPKAVSFFGDVRSTTLEAKKSRLFVEMPGDATLYVDGKESLSTSLQLPPGAHYVLVEGGGGKRAFQAVVLAEGDDKRLRIRLERAVLAEAGTTDDARAEQTQLLYAALGRHANAGLLVLAGETGQGEVALQLYEARTGNFSKAVTADAGGDPVGSILDLVPTLAQYVSDNGTLRTDRVSPRTTGLNVTTNPLLASILLDPEPIVETVTVTRKTPWYLWAGVGVLAAGGATATALLLDSGGEDPPQQTTGVIVVGPVP
jgi:hypothetical protein